MVNTPWLNQICYMFVVRNLFRLVHFHFDVYIAIWIFLFLWGELLGEIFHKYFMYKCPVLHVLKKYSRSTGESMIYQQSFCPESELFRFKLSRKRNNLMVFLLSETKNIQTF